MPEVEDIAVGQLGLIEGQSRIEVTESIWTFDDDDWVLMAMLQDEVYMSELLFEDPKNKDHGGCYRVMDYQYPLFRSTENYEGKPCSRAVGKTESIKAKSVCHVFRRQGEDMLVTAPELIHLLPLTDAIEDRLFDTRLTREFLDTRQGKTGFTHKPFQADFLDGTKIVGRIPKITGPQPVDTPIATPTGWAVMGDLKPGDQVVGSDGRPTEVLAVTNEWEAEIYELKFSDGSTTRADALHRWRVRTDSRDFTILNTEEIAGALAGPRKRNGGSLNMVRVPDQPLVEYTAHASPPPLDPYVVGALLGDGAISGKHAQFISADPEVVEEVRRLLPAGCSLTQTHEIKWLIVGPGRGFSNPTLAALRDLGMLGSTAHTKRIPHRYLYGSREERLALLQGLLDTDGSAKESGAAALVLASRGLVEDAVQLVRSLGGWASTGQESRHSGGVYWRTTLRIRGMQIFRLPRKARIYRVDGRQRHRSIRAVTPAGVATVKCIKVAAHDECYLTESLIPTLNTGVKGQHVPDLLIDEGQDYPEKGWIEVHETVMKDHVDSMGDPDFTYQFYGVHSGARDGRFYKLSTSGEFKITQITAMMRPGWGPDEKRRAAAIYGGTQSPDYRRNILGEAGGSSSAFFVTARLMACIDQDRESTYNTVEYKAQELRSEEVDQMLGDQEGVEKAARDQAMYDLLGSLLDLPELKAQQIYFGMDIGLVNDPTVIMLWTIDTDTKKKTRLKLVRMIHLWRFREKMIRQIMYHIGWKYGQRLRGVGMDVTGLGLPIFQAMEADEVAPQHLLDVSRGYVFNAKVPIGVDPTLVTKDSAGKLRDHYGNMVEEEEDPFTRTKRYVVKMTMIEASTRYLREFVDATFLLLPFDVSIAGDMQGETEQRVKAMAGVRKKPNAFHILDAMRAFAMVYKSAEVESQLAVRQQEPVMARAVDTSAPSLSLR